MRKPLCALAFFAGVTLQALPVGNPSEPALTCESTLNNELCSGAFKKWFLGNDPCVVNSFNVRIGFYGDYVFNRYLETQENHGNIQQTRITTNAGYIALNAYQWFDFFGTLGASQLNFYGNDFAFGANNGYITNIWTDSKFSWSAGGRIIFFNCDCLNMGFEGQYFSTRPQVSHVQFGSDIGVHYPTAVDAFWREWQLAMGASYQMGDLFCPYAAFKWARGNLTGNSSPLVGTTRMYDMKTARPWGYAVGMTVTGIPYATFTAEGRFADELALYINGQFQF